VAQRLRDGFSLRLLDRQLPGAPRTKKVVEALELLVSWGLGKKAKEGTYEFQYRKLRGGTLAYILKKLAPPPPKSKATISPLPSLFENGKPKSIARSSSPNPDNLK
jgi:hypothetical protein